MTEILLTHQISPDELLWFLSRGFDDPVYRVSGHSVFRAFKLNGEQLLVQITPGSWSVKIEWLFGQSTPQNIDLVKAFVNDWFDLGTDITPFYELLQADDSLHYMAEEFSGLPLVGMPDLFEALCWAIIGQQINLTFAYKIKRRLIEKYGDHIDHDDIRHHIFPSPQAIAEADPADLRELQLSGSKIAYLQNIARSFISGSIDKAILKSLPDLASRKLLLTAQKGIGVWTANYVLMKCLRDPSAIPFGDAGLLNALLSHGIITNKTDLSPMYDLFDKFKGWEAYLVFYLWRSLAPKPPIS